MAKIEPGWVTAEVALTPNEAKLLVKIGKYAKMGSAPVEEILKAAVHHALTSPGFPDWLGQNHHLVKVKPPEPPVKAEKAVLVDKSGNEHPLTWDDPESDPLADIATATTLISGTVYTNKGTIPIHLNSDDGTYTNSTPIHLNPGDYVVQTGKIKAGSILPKKIKESLDAMNGPSKVEGLSTENTENAPVSPYMWQEVGWATSEPEGPENPPEDAPVGSYMAETSLEGENKVWQKTKKGWVQVEHPVPATTEVFLNTPANSGFEESEDPAYWMSAEQKAVLNSLTKNHEALDHHSHTPPDAPF